MVHFSPSIEQQNTKFIIAKLTMCGVVHNERMNNLHVYRSLLKIAYMVKQLNHAWLTAEVTV